LTTLPSTARLGNRDDPKLRDTHLLDDPPLHCHTQAMTKPRTELIALEATPWYHVVSRCVRRAFLCGQDHASGQNYEHRRGWIEAGKLKLRDTHLLDDPPLHCHTQATNYGTPTYLTTLPSTATLKP
jgi:hypothetical protein